MPWGSSKLMAGGLLPVCPSAYKWLGWAVGTPPLEAVTSLMEPSGTWRNLAELEFDSSCGDELPAVKCLPEPLSWSKDPGYAAVTTKSVCQKMVCSIYVYIYIYSQVGQMQGHTCHNAE